MSPCYHRHKDVASGGGLFHMPILVWFRSEQILWILWKYLREENVGTEYDYYMVVWPTYLTYLSITHQ